HRALAPLAVGRGEVELAAGPQRLAKPAAHDHLPHRTVGEAPAAFVCSLGADHAEDRSTPGGDWRRWRPMRAGWRWAGTPAAGTHVLTSGRTRTCRGLRRAVLEGRHE